MSEAIIKVDKLSKRFETEEGYVNAVSEVSFEVNKGEIFGIIGLSGAGKSTLVRTLNLLEKPTEGTVTVNGKNLLELSEKELRAERQHIGMIFQHFNLLMQKNVLENVMFPLKIAGVNKAEAKSRALEMLEVVGLSEKAKAYPAQLSGGQKQRVAIARVLTMNPDIILSDEATSALDPQTTASILDLLQKLSKERGITVVVITHEMSVIKKICNRVAVLDGGDMVEIGEVEEVFKHPKTLAAKRLIFNEEGNLDNLKDVKAISEMRGGRTFRITFDGKSAFEPIIGNITLAFGVPVNILYANTHELNGKAEGEMVIELPEDKETAEKMINYLKERNIGLEEVSGYVG